MNTCGHCGQTILLILHLRLTSSPAAVCPEPVVFVSHTLRLIRDALQGNTGTLLLVVTWGYNTTSCGCCGQTEYYAKSLYSALRLTSSPAATCPEPLSRTSVVATVLAITWSYSNSQSHTVVGYYMYILNTVTQNIVSLFFDTS